ncbi:unnamed protein product [Miscanthus lutarioriparius]|uniref:Disease resistance R13L4/SHOC-2-like LRR domain-containing protein n=1 Tax=Miscanthus lutarioriparius TaxID=422564 RepID=A0A811QVD2_9POAL|nr:unnamed protein product [Miscanthus lutarioriparius]
MCTSSGDYEYDRRRLEHLGNLVHLRYLGLEGILVKELPEAIGALKLLQTLDMKGGGYIVEVTLPSSISLLTRLICQRCDGWTRLLDGFILQKLASQEELQKDVHMLSFEFRRQFFKELGNLSHLRVLHVLGTGRLNESKQEELLKSLGNLQQLQHLDLYSLAIMDAPASMEWLCFRNISGICV